MTVADEITAIWDEVRPEFAEVFHADTYEILRAQRTPGGTVLWTEQLPLVVEAGRCLLEESNGFGGDQSDGNVIIGLSPYTVELPISTLLTDDDRVRVNGRTYLVEDVKRGGNHRLFVVASLRERSEDAL